MTNLEHAIALNSRQDALAFIKVMAMGWMLLAIGISWTEWAAFDNRDINVRKLVQALKGAISDRTALSDRAGQIQQHHGRTGYY